MDFSKFKNHPRRILIRWRLMNIRKLLYLPHILNIQEKRIIYFLIFIILFGGGGLAIRIYLKTTVPVPKIGKTYIEGALKEPRTINPIYAAQDSDRDLTRLLYAGLFTYDGEGKIIPDLAENYEISSDGKNYTVTLKNNVFWHDGIKLDADDILFTFKTVQNPLYKSVVRANWQGVEIEKIDEATVRFSLRASYTPFIENLTLGILPRHLWENVSPEQALLHELNLKPVGSGPYQFSDFKTASDGSILWYELIRNPKYHREGPYLTKITFIFFKNEDTLKTALNRGAIEGFGPVQNIKYSELDQTKSIRDLQMPRIFSLFLNDKKNTILADRKIRLAINFAINKNELVQKTTIGAVPAFSPLPLLAYEMKSPGDYNPDESRKLLDEAGWKIQEDGGRGKKVKEGRTEKTIPLNFKLVTIDSPELLRTADSIKNMLEEVGIRLEIEKKSFNDLEIKILRPRDFEMLLFGQVYGFEADPFAFWHSSQIKDPGLNIALYTNKKVDQILEETRHLSDPIQRKEKYQEFSDLVISDMPAVFLYSQLYSYLLPTDIKGVNLSKISLPADRFNEINTWYRTTKRVFE